MGYFGSVPRSPYIVYILRLVFSHSLAIVYIVHVATAVDSDDYIIIPRF